MAKEHTTVKFTKMHGISNDYIYIDCFSDAPNVDFSLLSKSMSTRRSSVGADGIILILPSSVADAKMRIFNADGSEGKMCGNGIRCVGKFLFDKSIVKKTHITVETLSGIKTLDMIEKGGKIQSVTVDMGKAIFTPENIPVIHHGEMINQPVKVLNKHYNITAVSMGNPHAVIYCNDVDALELEKIGIFFENLSIFPERVNTEFVEKVAQNKLKMRVWERGSGETFACGTGACASVAASVKNGIYKPGEKITVELKGGELEIICDENYNITMTGPATTVYEGVYEYVD